MSSNILKTLLGLARRSARACATVALASAAMLPATQSAHALIGSPDVVPASTLLLPYFEVDLANENGAQTTMRISNASATATLVNVTLWTDLGVPTYSFPIYLVGFDTEEIDLRLLFKGIHPVTASAGQDPSDLISPQGQFSQDINFASCNTVIPLSLMPAATVTALRNAHTGQGSTLLGGSCGGVSRGDNIARGFVTMDLVNSCGGPAFPSDAGYFITNGAGRAQSYANLITGTVSYLNRSQNLAFGEPLVHIESDYTNPLTSGGTDKYTFYGRFNGFNGADNKEPASSTTQARYMNGGAFSAGSDLIVWRDPGVAVAPFACGGALPAPFPMSQQQIVAFDEEENPTLVGGNPFPYVAQKVAVSTLTSNQFGILRLQLTRAGGATAIAGRHQSAVSVRYIAGGAYGGSLQVPEITNAIRPANENISLPLGAN